MDNVLRCGYVEFFKRSSMCEGKLLPASDSSTIVYVVCLTFQPLSATEEGFGIIRTVVVACSKWSASTALWILCTYIVKSEFKIGSAEMEFSSQHINWIRRIPTYTPIYHQHVFDMVICTP